MNIYRQGDVLLVAVPHRRREMTPAAKVVVAEGEVTGHAHVLEPAPGAELLRDVDGEFLRIMGASGLLTHEEHATIELPPATYQVVRQREYTPEDIRTVAD